MKPVHRLTNPKRIRINRQSMQPINEIPSDEEAETQTEKPIDLLLLDALLLDPDRLLLDRDRLFLDPDRLLLDLDLLDPDRRLFDPDRLLFPLDVCLAFF